jgi:hypothetical protein
MNKKKFCHRIVQTNSDFVSQGDARSIAQRVCSCGRLRLVFFVD